ncbi:uncharacterized protein BDZ99DRAFT_516471 [Mytilinidion resinicola]|uniref:Uncharacterized protein n=1 Tax=Mytilinidion resinicola TaxID=574789 RepID=A0A6A6YZ57_9PEZI|nr:uncharacterized protein BDZ99DRAFT_516471 [Mytilinidion resinicola]KAF2813828.1 hypothetical protein BDZ99DRAFT_516471 [Mytilinidion resinicola]
MGLPVCRSLEKKGKISSHKIMTGYMFWKYSTELGYRVGYNDRLSGHALRRGLGNGLEVAARQQIMGHHGTTDQVFQKYYACNTVGIDLPSLVRRRSQNQDYINFARCITFGRHTNAPAPPGSFINSPDQFVPSKEELARLELRYPGREKRDLVRVAKKEDIKRRREAFFADVEHHRTGESNASSQDANQI